MNDVNYSTRMFLTHSIYKVFTNDLLLCIPQQSGYYFLSKWALLKLDKGKVHFLPPLGIKDNAEISIAFVLKIIRRVFLYKTISLFIVRCQRSCAVLSHCFIDCACTRESAFFV